MKPLFACVFAVALLGKLFGADPVELTQQSSPTKPAPSWLKIIDQGDNDPRLKGYKTPEGIKLEIVAQEPTVINPVGLTFADDGTPFVLEWRPGDARAVPETFVYKDGSKRNVATMKKNVKDVVKVLRHTGEQREAGAWYDAAKVILEDELPSSILLHDGWLYLSGRGTVRRVKQNKPDGPYDVKEVIAQGFGGRGHHQVSGMTVGNDGWLYVTAGQGDHYVEGSDGSRAAVLRSGAVFRCRPDGSKMHAFSLGYCNPYRDVAFDALGNIFQADNDVADGSKFTGCRLMHVVEGSDFGWRVRSGVPDTVRGAVFGELPGKLPPLLKTGRGAPAGLLIYNDTRLPEYYQGLLFYPDVFRKLIRAYKVKKNGASFEVVEEFEFLKSDDPLFRPCQMVVGPDGAIYVVDWRTDSGGAGRLSGDGTHGRIYRISWGGTKKEPALLLRGTDSWAKLAKLDDAALLKALADSEASLSTQAQRELVKRGDKNRTALLEMLSDTDQPITGRVAVLGVLQSMWNDKVQEGFERLLTQGNVDLRRLAAEGLGLNAAKGDADVHVALVKVFDDKNPAVRRAIALAISRIAGPGAGDTLAAAVGNEEGHDVYLFDGLVRAVEGLGARGLERLLAVADSGVQKETDRVVEAWTAFRTRPAAEMLPALLKNPHLSSGQRAALVRSYSNYLLDPPISLDPLLEYLKANPNEGAPVRRAALEALAVGGALTTEKGFAWLQSQDPALQAEAVRVLGADAAGAKTVAQRYLDKKLPSSLLPQVLEALRKHAAGDPEAAKLLSEVLKSNAPEK